jgi:NhaA family Na+:H+ antiporter
MREGDEGLPAERVDGITASLARFIKIEALAGVLLLGATLVAVVLSNSPWREPYAAYWEIPIGLRFGAWDFTRSLQHWVNDGLMTLFFFVVALELKRELVLGELKDWRRAALAFFGALGGMLAPAALYFVLMQGRPGAGGWGTVVATDTAFVIGCLALFGRRLPASLRLFLLSLAIFDDLGAILVVALGYGDSLHWRALALTGLFLAVIAGAARLGLRSIPVHVALGVAAWLCCDAAGVHPTVVGVALGLLTPARAWVSDERLRGILERLLARPAGDDWSGDTKARSDLRRAGSAVTETLSPVERLQLALHPWVGLAIMPAFALANAGVSFAEAGLGDRLTVAIFAGLVIGKPIGILGFTWLALRTGIATRSPDLTWPLLTAGGCLAGIGFTMSLFIAGLAFSESLLPGAKLGILVGSATAAAAGLAVLGWQVRRSRPPRSPSS